jgi:hypothetical protein
MLRTALAILALAISLSAPVPPSDGPIPDCTPVSCD